MRIPSDSEYQKALQLVGCYWGSRGRLPKTAAIARAYRIVGSYTHKHHAPKAGVPHPNKSATERLRMNFRPSPPLTREMKIVTRIVRTNTPTGVRNWTEVWIEIADPKLGCVRRIRRGLRGATISIRGLHVGRSAGPKKFKPCGWRPLTSKELKDLPAQAVQFLSAIGSSAAR